MCDNLESIEELKTRESILFLSADCGCTDSDCSAWSTWEIAPDGRVSIKEQGVV
jgi:hypothetical protein